MVFNLVLQYIQNYEEAEEITQDVFVSIYQSINSFKQNSKISTWIYRITINKSLDFIKSKQRQKRFGLLSSFFSNNIHDYKSEFSNFNHPGVELEHKEALKTLFAQINSLPNKQKTALILSKIEDKSQAEIAEIMEMSTKAVESLIQRAKTNLSKKRNQNEGK